MIDDKITVKLPPNVEIIQNSMGDFEYLEKNDPKPLLIHPKDTDSARKLVFQIWQRKHEKMDTTWKCGYCGCPKIEFIDCPNINCPRKIINAR